MNSIKHSIYILFIYNFKFKEKCLFLKKMKILSDFFYWQLFVQLGSYYLKDIYQKHLCISTFA